jgi:hypothetical protein
LSPGGTDQDQGTPENNLRGHLKLASGYRRPEKLLCSGFVSGIAAVTTGNTCAFRSVQKTMRTSRKLFLIQWKRFRNLTAGLARRNFLWFVVRHEFSNRKFRGSNLPLQVTGLVLTLSRVPRVATSVYPSASAYPSILRPPHCNHYPGFSRPVIVDLPCRASFRSPPTQGEFHG